MPFFICHPVDLFVTRKIEHFYEKDFKVMITCIVKTVRFRDDMKTPKSMKLAFVSDTMKPVEQNKPIHKYSGDK